MSAETIKGKNGAGNKPSVTVFLLTSGQTVIGKPVGQDEATLVLEDAKIVQVIPRENKQVEMRFHPAIQGGTGKTYILKSHCMGQPEGIQQSLLDAYLDATRKIQTGQFILPGRS